MKPIGVPITSFWQGALLITFFGSLSGMTAYFTYKDKDINEGIASCCLTAITGLATYNTAAYLIGESSLGE